MGAIRAFCLLGEKVPQRVLGESHHDDVRGVVDGKCLGL